MGAILILRGGLYALYMHGNTTVVVVSVGEAGSSRIRLQGFYLLPPLS